ncbi:receptor like protein 27-like [Gossypium hirsutum]|uniref:Receptor like protein 27-like n=1 Tax=Gossypium hirsutum TaxID=3635 RepID=A0ABM3BJC5_GOSHI|nr:receptor like protein 27-like [Gossypium hirsutum]
MHLIEIDSQSLREIYLPQNQFIGGFSEVKEFERPSYITSPLAVIDLHGNQLQGKKPIFPPKVVYLDYSSNNFSSVLPHEIGEFLQLACFFSLSRNNFHGSIPKSICQGSSLLVLDLSNNSLSGSVPECLIQMSVSLGVLNLKRNNLSSNIPDTFPENCVLQTPDLNRNRQGEKSTSRLRVLVLRSNKFKRDVNCRENITWLMLQIIDLASNSFGGKLPHGLLMTWNAMMTEKDEPYSEILHFQFLKLSELSFLDSMTVTMKGLELELVKILTIFTSIDFSSNKFEGPIPEAIGDFRVLYLLNFSNNALTCTIPSFLGNLLKLEALDLSSNHLIGQIPLQLANLNFLSFLNLSNNELIGKIPLGTQIQSFPEASFENNARLCGLPLKALCESPAVTKVDPSNPRTGNHINWNLISVEIGFVFGLRAGIVPLMFWK